MLSAVTGCHRHPQGVTQIPDYTQHPTPGVNPGDNNTPGGVAIPNTPGPTATPEGTPESYGAKYGPLLDGPHNEDREKFKEDTVYFDFDSATIKSSEESKLTDLANYFKGNEKLEALIIEGNCDERGTEKYNLSLGERRALAVREYLGNLGVDAQRIKTVTYGASRPVDPGHNEAAWKQNRRDDFVLVTPK
ncbi:MAG TPA: OmpA family protein [Verrucomicrobiae bacterium]|nr:OmpA family protein [Verrucomicrobiae bacterium]